jgi:hypothetical protein
LSEEYQDNVISPRSVKPAFLNASMPGNLPEEDKQRKGTKRTKYDYRERMNGARNNHFDEEEWCLKHCKLEH